MKFMRLEIRSRTGHFDFAHPSDENISMSITVWDNEGNRVNGCSITPEYEMETSDFDPETIVDEVADMIEAYQKRLWISTSREKDLAFAKWLRKNKKKILKGNEAYAYKKMLERKEQLEKELASINEKIVSQNGGSTK